MNRPSLRTTRVPTIPLTAATALLLVGGLFAATPATADPRTERASGDTPGATSADTTSSAAQVPARAAPRLRVRRVVGDLDIPWDVQAIGGGRLLVTERDRKRLSLVQRGKRRTVRFPRRTVWVSGETGLLSLAVSPDFGRSRRFYLCHGGYTQRGHDVRVVSYRLSKNGRRARGRKVLLTGIPATSGRHGGCRLLVDRTSRALYVGTGDAADGRHPRDLRSLGGKVLRLDPATGRPWPGNPFIDSPHRRTRYVLTYGHRNVQGLAQRADGTVWSVEHGSHRDDEVNLLVPGGDYGWHPVPGYNESVPMTDHALPGDQVDARWRSGPTTFATSGAAWVPRRGWGNLGGTLAVAALRTSRVLFLSFDRRGRLQRTRTPAALRRYGRLRSVTATPGGGRLLITTSNGGGRDAILEVRRRR